MRNWKVAAALGLGAVLGIVIGAEAAKPQDACGNTELLAKHINGQIATLDAKIDTLLTLMTKER